VVKTREKVSQTLKEDIPAFYERGDISRMTDGNKVKVQKHCLSLSIMEEYMTYISEKRTLFGKSCFVNLRPQHILPFRETPHNICTCQIHDDFME
jgi:hypothetical protein